MLQTPIKITLYDPQTHEAMKEYSQSVITFDMLFKAAGLSEVLNKPKTKRKWWMWWEKKITSEQEMVEALMRLVVDFFRDQFTVEQLRTGADVSEVMTVLHSIMARSQGIMQGNPTRPRGTRQRHKNQTASAEDTGS